MCVVTCLINLRTFGECYYFHIEDTSIEFRSCAGRSTSMYFANTGAQHNYKLILAKWTVTVLVGWLEHLNNISTLCRPCWEIKICWTAPQLGMKLDLCTYCSVDGGEVTYSDDS